MGLTTYALTLVLAVSSASNGCQVATFADLMEQLQRGGKTDIVVFATWCGPCREHVRRAGPHTLLVGAFDDPARLSRAVQQLNPGAACFMGEALVRQLRINRVPMRLRWHDGVLTPVAEAVAP